MAYNPRIATQYLPVRGMDKALAFMNSEYLQAVVDVPLGLVFGTKPRIMRPPHFDKNVELPMVFSKLVEQLGREAFPYLITCGFVAYRIVNDVPQIVNLNNGRVTLSITKKLEILLHFTWNRVTADMISTRKYIANTLVANSDPKVHFFVLKYPTNRGELQSAMVPAIDLLERIHVLRKLELEQERRRTYPTATSILLCGTGLMRGSSMRFGTANETPATLSSASSSRWTRYSSQKVDLRL